MFPAYTDKQDGSTVHAGQITEVISTPFVHPDPKACDPQRTKLKFGDGSESICYGKWVNDNNPQAGQWFVMLDRGAGLKLMSGVDFLRGYTPLEE